MVADLVEADVLPPAPYTELRRCLLQSHTLTPYQQVENLFDHPGLGNQRPSELLASMVRACPRGQEDSLFFRYLFLHRLPRELRVLLADMEMDDRRALADRADHLWAHNVRGHTEAVATVAAVPEPVAAVQSQQSSHQRKKKKQPGQQSRQQSSQQSGQHSGQQAELHPSNVARQAALLC